MDVQPVIAELIEGHVVVLPHPDERFHHAKPSLSRWNPTWNLYARRLGSSGPPASHLASTNRRSDRRLRYLTASGFTSRPVPRRLMMRRSARRTEVLARSRAADDGLAPGTMNSWGSGCSATVSSMIRSRASTIVAVTNDISGRSFAR